MTYRLHVGDPERAGIAVVRSPQFSAVSLTLSAAIRRTRIGTTPNPDWRPPDDVVRALRPASGFALSPILRTGLAVIPEVSSPIVEPRDVSVAEQVDALHAAPDRALLDDLAGVYGADVPEFWQPAAERPDRWRASMASAVTDTWRALEPTWHGAAARLGTEIERAGTARVRGATGALLDTLHERIHFADGWLSVDTATEESFELGGRTLILVPMLVGPHAMIVNFMHPRYAWIGYPLPGTAAPRSTRGPDPLAEVLGDVRAAILRAVVVPMAAGALASAVQAAPNTVSYHCAQLERSGLLARRRVGRSVRIAATDRGRQLIDLLAG